ncbi:restriction endonuclease subunit S [Lysobacter sp. H23M47]|uniref:restriction endonuclease subunit S n=1 Tax=Lysobacter sp. H23M47 TaxID=2781024 RepID=UPI00187FDC24|nr:restriction endonuclease subunit S [Lysobacter sp. H23M47]QOW23660.1 restriction endonuclease subunit S [Lysobacter sp. H23M47]
MIDGLKPYAEMKDSELCWLGDIPAHWRVKRAKAVLRRIDVRSSAGAEELLTVSSARGVVPRRTANVTMFQAESYAGHKLCWPGDLVINSLWAWGKGLGVSQHHGIVSTAYGVYRARDASGILPRYLHELVRSSPFHWELQVRSKGVWISRLQLTDESFLNAPLVVPPLDEQAAIVRFLDHADRRIRLAIAAKQKLIKLLEEQKQAIIHRAVTRGLDPDVCLKPSGVAWLGDVPAHWEITRLGRLIKLTTGFPFKSDGFTHVDDDIRLMRGINVSPARLRWDNVVRWPMSERPNFREYELIPGDIVLGMDRPIIQRGIRLAVVKEVDVPSLLLQRVARIRVRGDLNAEFAALLLSGRNFASYLAPIFTGISVPHLSPEQIKAFRLALPRAEEQQKIVEDVTVRTGAIRSAIDRAEREIELLREYRTRLIADVVTGKLDVREAAARLPDEVESAEPARDEFTADEESDPIEVDDEAEIEGVAG